MTAYDYLVVDVFADEPFGGNQLAVLPDARGLDGSQMQQIAKEFNLAETTFVSPPTESTHTARVRIFTPAAELPFAGHPTVGTAAALVDLGIASVIDGRAEVRLEEDIGVVDVTVTSASGRLFSEMRLRQRLELPSERPDAGALAAALTLPRAVVDDAWYAGIGVRFCFCLLANEADVDRAVLDQAAWRDALGASWAQQLFFFAGDLRDGGCVYARMFAPALGIAEDAATGSASAALAAYLGHLTGGSGQRRFQIRQGVAMGRPSVIQCGVDVRDGVMQQVRVGGHVAVFARGSLHVANPLA